jgi:uncharacterized protein YcnI
MRVVSLTLATAVAALPASAQVALSPTSVAPAAIERVALRVVNQSDTGIVQVRLEVPEAFAILGLDAPPGWTASRTSATATTPQAVEWAGGTLERGRFLEFSVLGRLAADSRNTALTFPVRVTREGGGTVSWTRGGDAAPLALEVRGTTEVSAWGALALGAAALGLAGLAVALALRNR